MPCVAFHCPGNPFLWKELHDCEACDHKCLSIETIRLIWKTNFTDVEGHYHGDPKVISVTETMGCPRRAYFERTEEYAEEPIKMKARTWGTIMHAAREKANDDGCSEITLSYDMQGDYYLKGTVDRMTDEYVMDYKTCDNPRKTYDEANALQVSIYDGWGGVEGTRRLLILQDGRRDEVVHEVHRVPDAFNWALNRAEDIVEAVEAEDVSRLAAEGREKMMGFSGKPMCNWCPFVDQCGMADCVEYVNE